MVRGMCDMLIHRGPDGKGFYEDEHAVLGIRRLAIVDMATGGQPVYNEDRTVVAVLNGEIYNFVELRRELIDRGHRFTSDGDTECLVHLYEEFGDDLVHHLRGMFAFAIWDRSKRRLLLVRDRVGNKPLFWRVSGHTLWFGTELKALTRDPSVNRQLDPVALHHYLTYQYVPAPWSIYRGIHKLPPGNLLVWKDGVIELRRYWRLDCTPREIASKRRPQNGFATTCSTLHACAW
jgi:asparagine synthase (glutamine-hydrolysing)